MNYRIHLLRAIAIFLVILNHVSSWCQFYKSSQYVRSAYMSVAATGVPIFIMISGSLLISKYDEPIKVFLKKRISRLLIPFVTWSYVYLVYQKYVPLLPWQRLIKVKDISYNPIYLFKHPAYGHLWFMYILISLYLTIPILRKLCKNISLKFLGYVMLLLFLGSIQQFLTTIMGQPLIFQGLNFSIMMEYTIYLFWGFIFTQTVLKEKLTLKISSIILSLGVLFTFGMTYIYMKSKGIPSDIFMTQDSPFIMLTSIGIFGITMNLSIPEKLVKLIKSLGDASFGIYFVHFIPLYVLTLIKPTSKSMFLLANPILIIPIISLICFLLSYLIIIAIKRVPYIKNVV